MKKVLFMLALLIAFPVCAQQSPFTPYPQYATGGWGKGGKPKPVIPEPSAYGAIFAGIFSTIYLYKRYNRFIRYKR